MVDPEGAEQGSKNDIICACCRRFASGEGANGLARSGRGTIDKERSGK